jgi:hypothetical protein
MNALCTFLTASFSLSLLTGCSEKVQTVSATAVVVSVYSKEIDIASLRVRVLDAGLSKSGDSASYPIGTDQAKFPFSFTVVPPRASSSGRFVVRVEGLDEDGSVRVSVQAQATFFPGKTRLLTLWLAALCEDVVCDEDQTCHYEDGDHLAGKCGEILNPKLGDFTPGADGDLSQFPRLGSPSSEAVDGGTEEPDIDADQAREAGAPLSDSGTSDPEAGPPLPPAPNLPTIGSLRTLGARRANSDNSMVLFDDGFEESGKVCNPDGLCAVAGFVP